LLRYDNGDQIPQDHTVDRLGKLYGAPQMVFEHFGYNNDIGFRYFPRPLNQIDRSMPAICFKTPEELDEMVQAVRAMCNMVLNNRDLNTWGFTSQFDSNFLQIIDVEQLILEAKIKYADIRGLSELEERYREHDRKCEANGYRINTDKRKTPMASETRAQYKTSCF
jgi:hypothetical protein